MKFTNCMQKTSADHLIQNGSNLYQPHKYAMVAAFSMAIKVINICGLFDTDTFRYCVNIA
jgi:hypothetical protein